MFPSLRTVRKSAAHAVTKNSRPRIPLALELLEDRLPPGQLSNLLTNPLADIFSVLMDQPGHLRLDDTIDSMPMVGAHGGKAVGGVAEVARLRDGSLPNSGEFGYGNRITDDQLKSPFISQPSPLLSATNAMPASELADDEGYIRYALEQPSDSYAPNVPPGTEPVKTPGFVRVMSNGWTAQVNVDSQGNNIVGDAANEPSLAVDPTNPNRIVIGWRQFDTVASNFRQAGWGYSHNGGRTWTFPGVIERGTFRSDPVLDVDASGNFYYNSLTTDPYTTHVFKSTNGGVSWDGGTFSYGGDKQWFVVDRTNGPGRGNIYEMWNRSFTTYGGDFTRSTNGGQSYTQPINMPGNPYWGTLAVGAQSQLYISGRVGTGFRALRSMNAHDPTATPTFASANVSLGGSLVSFGAPNPGGLLGQSWIATHLASGNIYFLSPVDPAGADPLDIMIARSTDGGVTFSPPVRVNDDPQVAGAWQWMAAMSVAPNGRIDAVWVDTRSTLQANMGQLYYSYSTNAGVTWSRNAAVSPIFNSHVGWPQQNKIGDYYQSISDNQGVNVAYAATFNNEQDVYFLRINVPSPGLTAP